MNKYLKLKIRKIGGREGGTDGWMDITPVAKINNDVNNDDNNDGDTL